MKDQLDPSHILQTATAFWGSKVLLNAVELDIFSTLGDSVMTASQLGEALGLHPRGTYDFFDALVALKFLDRDGDGSGGQYKNTPETAAFLNKRSSTYIGGLAEMLNARLFGFWNDLGTALKTGQPQNEVKHNRKPMFEDVYSNKSRLAQFLRAMNGFQTQNFMQLADRFDFSPYQTVSDIGGALALLSRTVGARHVHLTFTSFDLPAVVPYAQKHIDAAGMADRIKAVAGDFFKDQLPKADVVTMGNILHDWNLEEKKLLIKKVYDALPEGGVFIAVANLIDDVRRENVFGLLMSLNMLIEFGDAFDYTGENFREWCSEAGFNRFEIINLGGPAGAAIAYK
ncbi:MAG: acetylserotonin O-methyltransferase [Gammaproteobacteria bacterium]|nr:acetylserotonin O-methyltransferase [Gammaproteobacteria bacterium]